jgi:hypothetical protein
VFDPSGIGAGCMPHAEAAMAPQIASAACGSCSDLPLTLCERSRRPRVALDPALLLGARSEALLKHGRQQRLLVG